jgi:hypothetical protein
LFVHRPYAGKPYIYKGLARIGAMHKLVALLLEVSTDFTRFGHPTSWFCAWGVHTALFFIR